MSQTNEIFTPHVGRVNGKLDGVNWMELVFGTIYEKLDGVNGKIKITMT